LPGQDLYLLELVRYIHLNPLRARIVMDLRALDKYPYAGHSVIMGQRKTEWQDADYILRSYDRKRLMARRRYREYVERGIDDGRRPDLVCGGLVRNAGGWSVVKARHKGIERVNGDERISGDGAFVESVLKAAQEDLERKSRLQALAPGKYSQNLKARSLLCYWGTRELGMTTVELSKKLNLAQPTVSQAAARGRKIAQENGFCLRE
jgi:putative transposase